MYLLNAETLELEPFLDDSSRPPYAILSHTWGEEEVTFKDIADLERAKGMTGFAKIKYTCDQAVKDGLTHAWVDTCCIDKSSSAELSEAINSMFAWYHQSQICYALLEDVPGLPNGMNEIPAPQSNTTIASFEEEELTTEAKAFVASRWFTRGWTLQELLAPGHIEFFGAEWNKLGSLSRKLPSSFARLVSHATTIPIDVVTRDVNFRKESVAKRMSWMARRSTTRKEDEAYCLLGIFDVNMPLLYGEGAKAFRRLQEAIAQSSHDHSIFAWGPEPEEFGELFADSPLRFAHCYHIAREWVQAFNSKYTMTKENLEIDVILCQEPVENLYTYAILDCFDERDPSLLIVLRLLPLGTGTLRSFDLDQPSVLSNYCTPHGVTRTRISIRRNDARSQHPPLDRIYLRFYDSTRRDGDMKKLLPKRETIASWSVRVKSVYPSSAWDMNSLSCTEGEGIVVVDLSFNDHKQSSTPESSKVVTVYFALSTSDIFKNVRVCEYKGEGLDDLLNYEERHGKQRICTLPASLAVSAETFELQSNLVLAISFRANLEVKEMFVKNRARLLPNFLGMVAGLRSDGRLRWTKHLKQWDTRDRVRLMQHLLQDCLNISDGLIQPLLLREKKMGTGWRKERRENNLERFLRSSDSGVPYLKKIE